MTVVSVSLKGISELKAKWKKREDALKNDIKRVIHKGAADIQATARDSLTADGKTGIVYGDHQASAPGEAPATDQGELRRGIKIRMDSDGYGATVRSEAPYSAALEFGTTEAGKDHDIVIEPRPFMGPAFEAHKDEINKGIKAAYHKSVQA